MININNLITNWRTTTAGITIIVTSVVAIIHGWKTLDANGWSNTIVGLIGGIAFIYAADANVKPPQT